MKNILMCLILAVLFPAAFMTGCGGAPSGPSYSTATATVTGTITPATATASGTPATATATATAQAAQAAVNLNSAAAFAVLGFSDLTNSGSTGICGDLGLWSGTSGGGGYVYSCGGSAHINDTAAQNAQGDLTTAMGDADARTLPVLVAGDLGGLTLYRGLYKSNGTLGVTGELTLDAQGDANAVFIFQVSTALSTATSSHVTLIGDAKATNVFWRVGTSCALGGSSSFKGTIMAGTLISFGTGAVLEGRALSKTEVTMLSNTITRPTP